MEKNIEIDHLYIFEGNILYKNQIINGYISLILKQKKNCDINLNKDYTINLKFFFNNFSIKDLNGPVLVSKTGLLTNLNKSIVKYDNQTEELTLNSADIVGLFNMTEVSSVGCEYIKAICDSCSPTNVNNCYFVCNYDCS